MVKVIREHWPGTATGYHGLQQHPRGVAVPECVGMSCLKTRKQAQRAGIVHTLPMPFHM